MNNNVLQSLLQEALTDLFYLEVITYHKYCWFLKEIALIQTPCSSQFHCSLTAFLTSTLLQCLVYCSVPFRIFWFSEVMVQGEGSFSTIKESYCKSWLSPLIFQIPVFCWFSYYEKIILQIITEINTL